MCREKLSALHIFDYDLHDDKRNSKRLSASRFYDLFYVSRLIEDMIYFNKLEPLYYFRRNEYQALTNVKNFIYFLKYQEYQVVYREIISRGLRC